MKNDKKNNNDEEITQDIINLVVARLEAIPSKAKISIGNGRSFSKDELIEHVKAKDEIGRESVKIQLDYIRSLKDLPIEEDVTSNYKTAF